MSFEKKPTVLILFPGEHLAYSPTIINLYDFLSAHFEVTIIAPHPRKFNNQLLEHRKVIYHNFKYKVLAVLINRIRFEIEVWFKRFARLFKKRNLNTGDYFYAFKLIKKYIAKEKPDHIIAVDFRNLFFCQVLGQKAVFLSLEIREPNKYYPHCDFKNVDSVIIQSEERYKYLFKDKIFKTFYIQNAPVYKEFAPLNERKGLVYCGTAWDDFGFYHCLRYLAEYPDQQMTVKGALLEKDRERVEKNFGQLLKQRRLIIDDSYADESEIITYLSNFRIGFCFYNFENEHIRTFNYYTAPSGKLFKYFAAGVPVIAIDISGLQAVREFDCGVMIKDLLPATIRDAVLRIESNFNNYSANCLKAAQHYSFDKTVEPFVQHLLGK